MTTFPILKEPELTSEAIRVLMRELGPLNALRFIARVSPNSDDIDSVQRHREFAATVEQDKDFLEKMLRLIDEANQTRGESSSSTQHYGQNP